MCWFSISIPANLCRSVDSSGLFPSASQEKKNEKRSDQNQHDAINMFVDLQTSASTKSKDSLVLRLFTEQSTYALTLAVQNALKILLIIGILSLRDPLHQIGASLFKSANRLANLNAELTIEWMFWIHFTLIAALGITASCRSVDRTRTKFCDKTTKESSEIIEIHDVLVD